MASTLIEFGTEVTGELKRRVSMGVANTMKMAVSRVMRRVVRDTPVDTGRARSNWQVGVGDLDLLDLDPYVPYPKGSGMNKSETANAEATIAAGDSRLAGYTKGDILLGNAVTNPRDGEGYIGELNAGTASPQAGPNFVELAILAGLEEIRGVDLTPDTSFNFGANALPF